MESRVKFFGHPVHPMLIVFPIGLLATSLLFDILYFITRNTNFTNASYYMIAAGVIGGLLAAIFGFIDWLGLPGDSRAKRIGGWHGLGNFTIVVLFIISWFLRRGNANFIPGTAALILSILGIGLALITAWIGGELIYRLGVAVDPGANVNAPSSLTEPSATGTRAKRTANR
jgi:uncharacterized membrane protein